MSLNSLVSTPSVSGNSSGSGSINDNKRINMLSSMLFLRCVSGSRVISTIEHKEFCGYKFEGWGAHHSNYPQPYLTAAAALGIQKSDIDLFIQKLDKTMNKVKGKSSPATPTSVEELTSMSGRRSAGRSTINGDASVADHGSSASTSLTSSKDSLRNNKSIGK